MSGTIGVIGVGRMGSAVLANLAESGRHELLATDVRAEQREVVEALGGVWISDAGQLARAADVLLTLLPGSPELRDAAAGVIPALRPGSSWIDMTSAAPAVALELMAQASGRGIVCLDAPLGGGPPDIRRGRAQVFVGGDEDAVARHQPLLGRLGRIEHVGRLGSGYTTKLLVNLLWFTQAISVAEALLLAKRSGIDIVRLRDVVGRSAAASAFTARDLDHLLHGDYLETFGLDRCCEELDAVAQMADEQGLPLTLSGCVRDLYRRALTRYGAVDGELMAVAMLEEEAGLTLRRAPS